MKSKLVILILFINVTSFGQLIKESKKAITIDNDIKIATENISKNYVSGKTQLLKTKEIAIAVAEPILFSIYGKENILAEKPYNVILKNHMWIITGTLSEDSLGGTFLIILDSRNSKVLRVIHGK